MDDASPEREGEGVVFAFMASRKSPLAEADREQVAGAAGWQ